MFSFFSKKFSDTTSSNDFSFIGTDMHSHLIPGIDDGVSSLEKSIECIQQLKALGFSKIITTPHIMAEVYPNTPEIITQGLLSLRQALHQQQIDIEIQAAAEYKLDEGFSVLLEEDRLLTFGDKHILVELSFVAPPVNLDSLIFSLRTKGYKPILAHPERYGFWSDKLDKFEHLRSLGCLLQLNLMSLTNQYGSRAKEVAFKLLDKNMVDLLGTDLHRIEDIGSLQALLKSKNEYKKIRNLTLVNSLL